MTHTYTDIGTHKYIHIQATADSDTDTVSHFALLAQLVYMPKIQILYLAHHRQTQLHRYTHTCTGTPRDAPMYRHTQMCTWEMYGNCHFNPTFKLKWEKIVTFNGNSKEIITSNPLLS